MDGAYLRNVIISRCTEEGECLIWPGAMNGGYSPGMTFQGKNVSVRRFLWLNLGKKLPPKSAIKVKCREKRCVAEAHLELGRTGPTVGVPRGLAHKVKMAAIHRARSTLTMDDADEIRASDLSVNELAALYGKGITTIRRIRKGATWQPVMTGHFAGLGERRA